MFACYVFKPEKARGDNGVLLKEFLGIADIREILVAIDKGISNGESLALFPMSIPKFYPSSIHIEASTMMIGGTWRKFVTKKPEAKWSILAIFNVM